MILIVEDDPQVARLIALVLQRQGEKVDIVADGGAALEKARASRPSMIFADLTIDTLLETIDEQARRDTRR